MSDNPLLNKMDALLKKHRGGSEEAGNANAPLPASRNPSNMATSPPPNAWLPVLTDLIERGTPPAIPQAAAAPVPPSEPAILPAEAPPSDAINDTLTEQLMSELAPRLSEVMEQQVSAELRKSLDQTVANLLSQFDVSVREIVREAITEKLKPPRDPSS
ncbi:MAG: hypothetical protein Q8K57_08050 [Thiobacillus sp.]|nr:hypothetical protein [Thiobacillus sp.]